MSRKLLSVSSALPRAFSLHCTRCPRLAQHLADVRRAHPEYHARPVAPFGDANARLLVVGLAPGLHGANRTGRPFTGDHAGILLYETLHRHGFASRATSVAANDGLRLIDCRITNAVKCLPPANKPTPSEAATCRSYLAHELSRHARDGVLLTLGRVAHDSVLRALGLKHADYPFRHGADYLLPDGRRLLASYHCSRYNTQTRRLTTPMFNAVVRRARARLQK